MLKDNNSCVIIISTSAPILTCILW